MTSVVDDSGDSGGGGVQALPQQGEMPPPRKALAALIRSLQTLMTDALERPALFAPYGSVLRAAWPSVSERFGGILKELENISDEALASHGLSGPELEAKWTVFYGELARFDDSLRRIDRQWRRFVVGHAAPRVSLETAYPETERKRGVVRRVRDFSRRVVQSPLWRALAVADEVLGSIGAAHPAVGAAASALGEFKGTLEAVATPE